jgi:hypothetical protein
MAEPTIQQIFGSNAVITSGVLEITLADFANLTPGTATGEGILIAILLNAGVTLTTENWATNPDQSVQIDLDNQPSFTSRTVNNAARLEKSDSIGVTLTKVQGTNTIDPDDY